jgi:hypothetical protein
VSPEELALLAAIRSAVAPLPPSLVNTSRGSDLFEAYILTLIVQAARLEGGSVTYETVAETTPTQFYFRTSPGHMAQGHLWRHTLVFWSPASLRFCTSATSPF